MALFKRRDSIEEEDARSIDAAWAQAEREEREGAGSGAHARKGARHAAVASDEFPAPRGFESPGEEASPLSHRTEATAQPFDAEGSLETGADAEEFLENAEAFLDDGQTDYYEYGERMHNVRADIVTPDDMPATSATAIMPAGASAQGARVGKHGRQAPSKKQLEAAMPEHQRRSRRMRRVLIFVSIALIALIIAVGVLLIQLVQTSAEISAEQVNDTTLEIARVSEESKPRDVTSTNQKTTSVPHMLGLLGAMRDEAVEILAHGATVTFEAPATDEAADIRLTSTVALTDEPADSKSGTPTVYLGTNADGVVIQAGYSAATASLGYGSLSFSDAIGSEHVVEKTLNAAGLNVENGVATLPADASEYTKYAEDGTTRLSEKASFNGSSTVNGTEYKWSAVLSYDYAAANASGNLSDTVRQITVYVSPAVLPEVKTPPAPAEGEGGEGAPAEGEGGNPEEQAA